MNNSISIDEIISMTTAVTPNTWCTHHAKSSDSLHEIYQCIEKERLKKGEVMNNENKKNVATIIEYRGETPSTLTECVLPEVTFDSVKALCDSVNAFDVTAGIERVLHINDCAIRLINTTSDVEEEWEYINGSELSDWLDSINTAA